MNLDFSLTRWESVRETHRKWWAGTLGRPLVNLSIAGRDPGRPEPGIPSYEFASFYDASVSVEAIADRMVYDMECRRYLSDGFPVATPNFGPGVVAAFMGLEIQNGNGTVWFHQPDDLELADVVMKFDSENYWFKRVCDLYRALGEKSEGLFHLGMTDLGGNLDILSSFRPSETLAMDLYDEPETVKARTWDAHAIWWKYFEELNAVIQPAHPGYTAWTPFYSESPYYMLQCDFSFMLGTPMFDEFALPEIQASCKRLSNPYFHLDGPGILPHLDSLLAIPELKGIQWVAGAGQKPISEWPEVYQRIRAADKTFQFFTSQDPLGWRTLEVIADKLGSADGMMMFGEVPAHEEDEAMRMLARLGVV
jgi:5-methyltetrahydrofolate--homocysteine methyltransferase